MKEPEKTPEQKYHDNERWIKRFMNTLQDSPLLIIDKICLEEIKVRVDENIDLLNTIMEVPKDTK